jgi:hypothetical protein
MRTWIVTALAGAILATASMPAQAAWKSYVNRKLGFSFTAPGEVKAEVGNSRGQIAGPRQTIIYKSVDDSIEYKVTVISFMQAQAEGASLLGERQYMFQDRKKVLADTFARVGSGKDMVYGRKLVVELPDNKGRATGAFYFTKGRLVTLEATVPPAKGNAASPDVDRFVDSIAFVLSGTQPGAVELETPELD